MWAHGGPLAEPDVVVAHRYMSLAVEVLGDGYIHSAPFLAVDAPAHTSRFHTEDPRMDCVDQERVGGWSMKDVLMAQRTHWVRGARKDLVEDGLAVVERVASEMAPVVVDMLRYAPRGGKSEVLRLLVVGKMATAAMGMTQRLETCMGLALEHCSELHVVKARTACAVVAQSVFVEARFYYLKSAGILVAISNRTQNARQVRASLKSIEGEGHSSTSKRWG
jgi:hypothetical protein